MKTLASWRQSWLKQRTKKPWKSKSRVKSSQLKSSKSSKSSTSNECIRPLWLLVTTCHITHWIVLHMRRGVRRWLEADDAKLKSIYITRLYELVMHRRHGRRVRNQTYQTWSMEPYLIDLLLLRTTKGEIFLRFASGCTCGKDWAWLIWNWGFNVSNNLIM